MKHVQKSSRCENKLHLTASGAVDFNDPSTVCDVNNWIISSQPNVSCHKNEMYDLKR